MKHIEDDIAYLSGKGLLEKLLFDRTTKKNIIWGTDAHAGLGKAYQRNEEIRSELITGDFSGIVKTRAAKAANKQNDRTRQHAEVFTPVWICKKMNDYADEEWFGKAGVFEEEKVEFPKNLSWQKYVDSRRLEITCGEAPYLVSRYDAADGTEIPIKERIGILDRKLRVVCENAKNEDEWLKWAFRALEASYGYEFQGDNLLIARINVLMTFAEYLRKQWKRKPSDKEYTRLIKIITWNLWQMDGLTGTIPYCRAEEKNRQISLFEWAGLEEAPKGEQPACRIYDWRAKESVEYNSLKSE